MFQAAEIGRAVAPQPAMALLVMLARSLVWQRFPFLHGWVPDGLVINGSSTLTWTEAVENVLLADSATLCSTAG